MGYSVNYGSFCVGFWDSRLEDTTQAYDKRISGASSSAKSAEVNSSTWNMSTKGMAVDYTKGMGHGMGWYGM